jgi:hypothetical protein
MSLEDDHRRRVATFPDEIRKAHDASSAHRREVTESETCGCFYCTSVFPPARIDEWVDDVNGEGQTALCPVCGIDAVIGDRSGFPITRDFLERMKRHWF